MDAVTLTKAQRHFYGLLLSKEVPNSPAPDLSSDYQCGVWDCIRWIDQQLQAFDRELDEQSMEFTFDENDEAY